MHSREITTNRGEVFAIGEFKIRKSKDFPYEIPRLSYIITKEDKDTFASTCIDLHIDGDGKTPEDAEAAMGENVFDFLSANFYKKSNNVSIWEHLEELFEITEISKESWNAFSKFKLKLAKNGINTDMATELLERIYSLTNEINQLKEHDKNKEKITRGLLRRLLEQSKIINQLGKEKQMLEKVASLTAMQMLRNYEFYNTYWTKKFK